MGLFDNISFGYGKYSFGNSFGTSFDSYANYSYSNYSSRFNSYSSLPRWNTDYRSSYTPSYKFDFSPRSYSQDTSYRPQTYSTKTYQEPLKYTFKLGGGANNRGLYLGKTSDYAYLSKSAALSKAQNDSRLEYIGNGGYGWSVSHGSFIGDIKYATNGTADLLDEVVKEIRKQDKDFSLVVTSALGTSASPHAKKAGHYDLSSVKLDFGGGLSKSQATRVAQQLKSTGKFAFANIECDGATYHIDAQFKKELFA